MNSENMNNFPEIVRGVNRRYPPVVTMGKGVTLRELNLEGKMAKRKYEGSISSELYTVLESAIVVVNDIVRVCEKNNHWVNLKIHSDGKKVILHNFIQPTKGIPKHKE